MNELKDWTEIISQMQKLASSGSAQMEIISLQPKESEIDATESVQQIFAAAELINKGIRPSMQSLDLFESWHSRLKRQAVLRTIEIKDVRSFCLECLALKESLAQQSNFWSKEIFQKLMDSSEPLSAIDQVVTPGGEIRSDASETLYRLFKEKESLSKQIQQHLDRLVKDHDMTSYLQDRFVTTREGRWVIPIRSGMQHFVPGVIHGSSQTKQTVFTEPEVIIPLNNRLRQVEVEIEEEIERLLTELSHYLASRRDDFSLSREIMHQVDVLLAKAQWAIHTEAQSFQFVEKEIELLNVRHPLMKNPIPNTVHLDQNKGILLLSGPNAGGKTVLLKSVGLAAHMARCGLPICAESSSRLPFFAQIQVAIGDLQSVDAELSTFAAHLNILNDATRLSGYKSLVLIDEICGSTDPEEGSALARSFIEVYSQNHVFAVITSHLSPLKSGWKDTDYVLSGSMAYDKDAGRPTYTFLAGIPGESLAIQTAQRVGVTTKIVSRAKELLSPLARARQAQLEEIDQLKSSLQNLKQKLQIEIEETKKNQAHWKKLSSELEKDKEKILQSTLQKAQAQVDELMAQAKVEQTFKKHTALQEIKNQMPEIIKVTPSTQERTFNVDDFARAFPPGSKVYVPHLTREGIVQSSPNAKGEVQILSESIRLTLPWSDLKPAKTSHLSTGEILRRTGNVTVALQEQDRILDLRGKTVEEAISELEIQLDRSALQKEDRIKVIHGHGTDALKKAIRAYLSRSVYVKKWKAGSPEQGGDGMTWVELND